MQQVVRSLAPIAIILALLLFRGNRAIPEIAVILISSVLVLLFVACRPTSNRPKSADLDRADPNDESCDGEYMIFYDATKHPVTLEQLLQLLRQQSTYHCSLSEWQGPTPEYNLPIIRVETKMPVMIIDDHDKTVIEELEFFAKDEALSPSEAAFVMSCTARLQVSGAGPAEIIKLPNGLIVSRQAQYDPYAEDTKEVVRILMKAVDGIATCNTDGSWIHK